MGQMANYRNQQESNAWTVFKYGSSTYRVAESLLDIIRKKIAALTDYKPEMDHVLPAKPFTLQDENTYTSGKLVSLNHLLCTLSFILIIIPFRTQRKHLPVLECFQRLPIRQRDQ